MKLKFIWNSTLKALKIEDLYKNYKDIKAVDGVSFDIEEGEIFGLLGPNGAGKTTIVSIITSLERATSGEVKVFDKSVFLEENLTKCKIGVVPQEVVSHGFFKVHEILHIVSGYYGIKNNVQRIDAILKRLDLWQHRFKKIPQLSGGMKRRFMIAKALVHGPKLLLLDEPTAGVDIELKNSLWNLVKWLNKKEGITILLTTHYLQEAQELCDRVGIIDFGKLKKIGDTHSLIRNLTLRKVTLKLKAPISKIESKIVSTQKDDLIVFNMTYDEGIVSTLEKLNIDMENIKDFKIEEGDLEDVFVKIVGKKSIET